MIQSKINPDSVSYKSYYGIDSDDIDYDANIYDYELNKIHFEIALGKIKYTYSNYGILYCSVYLIINDSPVSKIGVFEIKETDILNDIEDDGLELENGHILLFASKNYIEKMLLKEEKKPPIKIENIEFEDDILEVTEIDDVLKLDIDKSKITDTNLKTMDKLKDGVFVSNTLMEIPPLLPEESKLESDELIAEYKETKNNNWIESFMQNNKYSLIDNEGSGDCFFAVVRDAYRQIGKDTTVNKLRAIVSREVTETIFNDYKTLYNNFYAEYQSIENEMNAIKKINLEMKRRITNITDKTEHQKLLEEATELSQRYKQLGEQRITTKNLLNEVLYMQDINNIEGLREYILTSRYWADEWAISVLERVLNVKMIIMDESAYKNDDKDGVLSCGPVYNLSKDQVLDPEYYIITSYNGEHYKLVTYKEKHIFKFKEIPYNIKNMVVNKCLERNSGVYYLINDFKMYKTKLGLDANYGEPIKDEDDYLNKNLYDSDITVMFHSKSDGSRNIGKGIGEKIENDKQIEYKLLNTKKKSDTLYNWRRKLDDEWYGPFTVDGKRWATIKHYTLGSQYKKGFPDFYSKFSLDSESNISNDVNIAIAAASKTGMYDKELIRPENVTIDADYFTLGNDKRSEDDRYKALIAKFSQNQDLNKVLLETKRAKLVKFVRRNDPQVDMLLMKVRKDLR